MKTRTGIMHTIQLLIALVITSILIAACGGGGGSATPAAITLSSIAVTPINDTLPLGSTLQLTATATYSNKTTASITSSVTWSSASSAVAAVDAKGLVTPAAAATAAAATAGQTVTITATQGTVSSTPVTITLAAARTTFSLDSCTTFNASGCEPLAYEQWPLHNTGQNGFADNSGTASTTTKGTDINVNSVYSTWGYTGLGVTVAVVDSGLEIAHEDMAANVVSGGSWNFENSSTDPTPTATGGDHGTSVAGLIAMAKNGIGGMGVAPSAKLKGFNTLAPGAGSNVNSIASLGGSSASPNSTDVAIFNMSYGGDYFSDTQVDATLEAQLASGSSTLRGGLGALYVKSAGNEFASYKVNGVDANCTTANTTLGISCQNAGSDPENTLPYIITVGALNAKGLKASYSNAGASLWIGAPGDEFGYNTSTYGTAGDPAMITTDVSGCAKGDSVTGSTTSLFNQGGASLGGINTNCNYSNSFNGTSSAAPMLSGVIALILEANPALTWREVKDILAKTAVQVDSAKTAVSVTLGNGDYVAVMPWITNAAGRKFHNWYGFGAVDANAAVTMARTYVSGSLGTFANTGWVDGTLPANATVPDNSITGVSVPVTVPKVGANGIVETVQLMMTTSAASPASTTGACSVTTSPTAGCTGDIAIELTSPSGTKSILKTILDSYNGDHLGAILLSSNAFYGEANTGAWTVKVVDGRAGAIDQTLTKVSIRVYGN